MLTHADRARFQEATEQRQQGRVVTHGHGSPPTSINNSRLVQLPPPPHAAANTDQDAGFFGSP